MKYRIAWFSFRSNFSGFGKPVSLNKANQMLLFKREEQIRTDGYLMFWIEKVEVETRMSGFNYIQ